MMQVIGQKGSGYLEELNFKYQLLSAALLLAIGLSIICGCARAQKPTDDIYADMSGRVKAILHKNSDHEAIVWIKGYLLYKHAGEYWMKFLFEPLNRVGDTGEILVREGDKQKCYWLGHDVPDKEIPNKIIYDKRKYVPVNIYAGDESAQINKNTNKVIINADDYSNYPRWSLILMKNEILARHGKIFSNDEVSRFFNSRTWYRKNDNQGEKTMTPIEMKNMEIIQKIINDKNKSNNYSDDLNTKE